MPPLKRLSSALLARFLLVLMPIFFLLGASGLGVLLRYDLRGADEQLATRVGNQAGRVASALARHDIFANDDLAHDILAALGADRAVRCAEIRLEFGQRIVAAIPPQLGCTGVTDEESLVVAVDTVPEASLHVRYSIAEVVDAIWFRRKLTLATLVAAFLIALVSATIGFSVTVGAPLDRLRGALRRAADSGERLPVPGGPRDALGEISQAYNALVERENERELALQTANRELSASRIALGATNAELEQRIAARTAALAAERDRAETASRAKSQFLSTMSHEIRTPLNGILGMVTLLRETTTEERVRRFADTANRSGRALLGLINNVLDLSKIESGKLELELRDLAVRRIVDDVVSLFVSDATAKSLRITSVIDDNVPELVGGDPTRLQQTLVNIVANAIKFTARGFVEIRVTCVDVEGPTAARLRFEVIDSGIGMTDEQQTRIFEAFEQADGSITRRYGGSGLGLAICRRLVAAMGGEIGVASKPNAGSRFWFTVPLLQATHSDDTSEIETAMPRVPKGLRVLVAEDNPVNTEVIVTMLDWLGCDIAHAEDGVEAVRQFKRHRPHLVLMDCHMPVLDGYAATREIRSLEHVEGLTPTPIVALTASAMTSDVERCRQAGMDDHLCKPFTRHQVAMMLCRHAALAKASTRPAA